MRNLPTARGDQPIARQVIRRLLWCLRRNPGGNLTGYYNRRIRALWGDR
jgi:hypothetical protein